MLRAILFCSVLITLFFSSSAQSSCQKYAFTSNKVFSACSDLPQLNSFLHWTYNPSLGTAQIAYRHTGITSSRWVAWAINPNSTGMVGSQAIVALLKSDGTMNVYTSSVDSYQTQLQKGALSFDVSDLSATHSNNEIVIFATVTLPNNSTTVNQVWQDGPVSNDAPAMHATTGSNVQSMATLNLLSGESAASAGASGASSTLRKMNVRHFFFYIPIFWGLFLSFEKL